MNSKQMGERRRRLWALAIAAVLVSGLQACGNMRIVGPGLSDNTPPTAGMDPNTFEIIDSSQVRFLDGLMAYGVGSTFGRFSQCGYGNLTGKPKPGKFAKLEIGLTMDQVVALAGYPDAQHVGLAKRQGFSLNKIDVREDYRLETSYVGVGRLVFAYVDRNYRQLQPGILNTNVPVPCPGMHLKWIIYNAHEPAGPLERENAHLTAYTGPPPEAPELKANAGMNDFGQVVDPCRLERGKGQVVDSPGQPAGEISGKAAPGSRFNLLRIGMTQEKVLDVLGPPSGTSACGRAVYDGMGELEYARSAAGSQRLSWIVHDANDRAGR